MEKIIQLSRDLFTILGPGFPEVVYQKALLHELQINGIQYETEAVYPILYKGRNIGSFRVDIFLPTEGIIIELKAIAGKLKGIDYNQIEKYMKYIIQGKSPSEQLLKSPSEQLLKSPSEQLLKSPSEQLLKSPSEQLLKSPMELLKGLLINFPQHTSLDIEFVTFPLRCIELR